MRKEIKRLERLYQEVCKLQPDEFDRFKEVMEQLDDSMLHSFCRQAKERREK